jgi:hypothetical protein
MEAVVDAYGSSERAMGWYYYLDGKMKVPFKARCRFTRPISVLKVKEEVEVLGMAPAPEFEIAAELLRARLRAGLSQTELAARMGTSQSHDRPP